MTTQNRAARRATESRAKKADKNTNGINLAHVVRDIRGKEVMATANGDRLTVRAVLVESLSVPVMGLAEQIERADLAREILDHEDDHLPVSGPKRAKLGDAIDGYRWSPLLIPDLLGQVDPERLKEIREKM